MTWGLAQAGNRASKTGRYLQWWENRPEWDAMTSAVRNSRHSTRFLFLADYSLNSQLGRSCGLGFLRWVELSPPRGDVHGKRFAAESALAVSFTPTLRELIFADGHTVSNAPDLFRPPKLSGTGPG